LLLNWNIFFLHQASWEHCDVEDNCFCSRTTFLKTRLAGSIVTSRIIAALGGLFFFKYQASWEHCGVEDNCCCCGVVFFNTRLAGSIEKSRIIEDAM
jgi:hypothetical protein